MVSAALMIQCFHFEKIQILPTQVGWAPVRRFGFGQIGCRATHPISGMYTCIFAYTPKRLEFIYYVIAQRIR